MFVNLDLASTRRLANFVLRPHPSLRVLRQPSPSSERSHSRSYHSEQLNRSLLSGENHVTDSTARGLRISTNPELSGDESIGLTYATPLPIVAEEVSCSGSEDSSTDTNKSSFSAFPYTSFNLDNEPHISPELRQPRVLRSYRHRKCQLINEAELAFLKVKDGEEAALSHSNTWPRTNDRSISWILSSSSDTALMGWPHYDNRVHSGEDILQGVKNHRPIQKSLAGAVPWDDTDYTQDFASLTDLHETTARHEDTVVQAIDRGSGVVFEQVRQGDEGAVQGASFLHNRNTCNLSYHLVPSGSTPFQATDDDIRSTYPSLVLTIPTPMVPQSPYFVPQSPITVPKFFSALPHAAHAETPNETRKIPMTLTPTLPSCAACGLFEFENNLQCRTCDKGWLACKVWYRAHDGGRRRWLTEPYIRPGESNARNRAIMRGLGVPCCLDTHSNANRESGTKFSPESGPIQKALRRVWRLSNMKTASSSESGNRDVFSESLFVRPLRVVVNFCQTSAALGLGCLLASVAKSWYDPLYKQPASYSLREEPTDYLQATARHELTQVHDLGAGCTNGLPYRNEGSLPRVSCFSSLRSGRASSKFVEHLAAQAKDLSAGA